MDESRYIKKKSKALNSGNDNLILSATIDLAAFYSKEEKYNEAVTEYRNAAEIYKTLKKQLDYAKMCRMIGDQYVNANKFGKAVHFYQIYVKVAENENNLIEQQRAYASMGHMYLTCYLSNCDLESEKENKEKLNLWLSNAKKMFIVSLKKSEKISDISKREIMEMSVRLFINLAVVAEYMGNILEALDLLQRSIEKSLENDIFDQLERAYSLIGALYGKQSECGKAIQQYNLAIKVAARLDDKVTLMSLSLEAKADIFLKLSDFQAAKSVLLKSYKLKKRHELDLQSISRTLKVVASICNTEDLLITTNTDDHATRKGLYEKIADGACILKQFTIAIDYYHKMYESAIKNFDHGETLNPCYISLAHTYLDNKEYKNSIKYFRLELANIYNMEDRLTTIFNIADATEKSGDLEVTETVYADALNECIDDSIKITILKRWLRMLNKYKTIKKVSVTHVSSKLEAFGVNLESQELSQESLETNSEDIAENVTENVGDEIDLDDLSDEDSNDSDVETSTTKLRRVASKPCSLTVRKNAKGETQLHTACIKGTVSLVKGLLQQGHPVNVRDYCGWQPLHEASLAGHLEIVKLLLDKGASINDRGGIQCNGMTPLHDAASNGHLAVIEYLLDKGASAIIKTDDGQMSFAILKTWRSSTELNPVEQTYYEEILQRLTTAMNKAGLRPDEENVNKRNVALVGEDDDSDESVSSVSVKRAEESGPLEYKYVMSMLRTKTEAPSNSLIKQNRKSDETKKPALLSTYEVGEDWLDDDLVLNKRKRISKGLDKFVKQTLYGDRVLNQTEGTNLKMSKSDFNEEASSSNRSQANVSTNGRFSLKSRSASYLESTKIKRKKYMIQPKLSNYLEHNSICEDSSSNDSPDVFDDVKKSPKPHLRVNPRSDSTQNSTIVNVINSPQRQPSFCSVDVTIDSRVFKISIAQDSVYQTKIDWLKQETVRRYMKMNQDKQPLIELVTTSGAFLDDGDLLAVLFPTKETVFVQLSAKILNWKNLTLLDRYKECCANQQVDLIPRVVAELQTYSGTIDLSHNVSFEMTKGNIDWNLHTGKVLKPFMNILRFSTNLTHLNLSSFPLEEDTENSLLEAIPFLSNLSHLNLSTSDIADYFIIRLADLIKTGDRLALASLISLNLSYNNLTNKSMEPLRDITRLLQLQELYLAYVKFSPGVFSKVLYLKLDFLKCFDISLNNLEKHELLSFISFCKPENLTNLNLADNNMGEEVGLAAETISFFAQIPQLENLKELNFKNCNVVDFDISEIVHFLPMAKNLEILILSYNKRITGVSLQLIFNNLAILPKRLDLSNCEELADKFNLDFNWSTFSNDTKKCSCIQLGKFDFKKDREICDMLILQWKTFRGNKAKYVEILNDLEMSIEGQEYQVYLNSLNFPLN